MKRRVPVKGGGEAKGLGGGDGWVESSWRKATFDHLEGKKKEQKKRGLWNVDYHQMCATEKWNLRKKVGHFHLKQEVSERLRSSGRESAGDLRVNRRKLNT